MTGQASAFDEIRREVTAREVVRIRAGGTKSDERDATTLSVAHLSGITEYTPEECVFTALAGTPIREIDQALRAHGQYLPFDPPFAQDGATIGGTVASGVSGPGRYRYGGVRDFLIGVRVIDGEGRLIRSGGKVVKNAAGFLLHHGMVGSCGRFGVIAEVTFKVFPAPAARRAIVQECGSAEAAFQTARRIEQLRCDCEAIDFDEHGTLQVTLAGSAAAIDRRAERLLQSVGASMQSPRAVSGHDPSTIVKVAGLMPHWETLREQVTSARFMCAGAVAWVATDDVTRLARALAAAGLAGQIIRGRGAGDRIGHVVVNEFEERVRQVLDPHHRFSAAPHPRH